MESQANDKAKTPLNQLYREKNTFQDYPEVKKIYDDIHKFTVDRELFKDPYFKRPIGRIYDQAVLYQAVPNWEGLTVCELGGRDGVFGSWITGQAKEVHVSDYFEEWGKGTEHDLGSFEYWSKIWKDAATNPDRLKCGVEDITKLSFPDNTFDVVICTSVIEHLHNQCEWQGDMVGIRECARILKPGGYLLLSTDMTDKKSKWCSGTFYFDGVDIFDRLINPSRCKLVGDHNFDFNDSNNSDAREFPPIGATVSSVVFALQK